MTIGPGDMYLYAKSQQEKRMTQEEWVNNHGNIVWFSEGYEPGTCWRKTGNKTLKELGKQEKRMTREEAVKVVKQEGYGSGIINALEKLGVLNLEEPKSVRDQAVAKLNNRGWYGEFIVSALEHNGFKIVKDPCNNS